MGKINSEVLNSKNLEKIKDYYTNEPEKFINIIIEDYLKHFDKSNMLNSLMINLETNVKFNLASKKFNTISDLLYNAVLLTVGLHIFLCLDISEICYLFDFDFKDRPKIFSTFIIEAGMKFEKELTETYFVGKIEILTNDLKNKYQQEFDNIIFNTKIF